MPAYPHDQIPFPRATLHSGEVIEYRGGVRTTIVKADEPVSSGAGEDNQNNKKEN